MSPVSEPSDLAVVRVPVTTVWQAPDRPRPVDRPIVGAEPDPAVWLAALDTHSGEDETGDGRLGLHGRIETQLVEDEPVRIVETTPDGAWAHVRCPWQPSPKSSDGYPGWVPAAHLRSLTTQAEPAPYGRPEQPAAAEPDGEHPAVSLARKHIGLPYLWGGLTPYGFDCSGLVHWAWRTLGTTVPRDAYAQQEALSAVDLDAVLSGDLYFFAHPGRRIHHVGIVTAPGRMVHASETGGVLVEEDLPAERMATLVAAARVAG
jgi:hypothetical protein